MLKVKENIIKNEILWLQIRALNFLLIYGFNINALLRIYRLRPFFTFLNSVQYPLEDIN